MSIHQFFSGDRVEIDGLALWLDGLDGAARVQAARELTAKEQAQLFEAAKGYHVIGLEDFVPAARKPLEQVRHYGRNSLPMFRIFEKRFCRPPDVTGQLWGYNANGPTQMFTGPGYFVCYPIEAGEVLIDYLQVPPGKPDDWPEIKPNSAGLSRFIYNGTQDTMRGVSKHVTIGRAARGGKPMDNWFVLCRES